MPTYDASLNASGNNYILRLITSEGTKNVANNTTVVSWSLRIIKGTGSGRYSFYTKSWSINIGGQTSSGTISGYDFRNYSELVLGSGTKTITHNADGTKVNMPVSGSFTDGGVVNIGSNTASGPMTLTAIARASTPTFNLSAVDAGSPITINTNRADASFTHTATYSFGAATGTIATGIGASTAWTPPTSLLAQIPTTTEGTLTVTLETFSGGVSIGTRTATFTLRAGAAIKPTISSLTIVESVSLVASQVGAFVKLLSKPTITINGAAAGEGSNLGANAYKIEVAGQTISAASGTTPEGLATSGTVAVTATVTDARGRVGTLTTNITVLNYADPVLTSAIARRADAGGTLNDQGLSIRVDLNAAVSSLLNSTQRNTITYRVSTRLRGTTTWTVRTTTTPAGLAYNSFFVISGTYATTSSWEVLIEVYDKFRTKTDIETVATAAIFMHWGGGLGIGKYWEAGRGTVDALGQMYQNDGLAVIDTGDVATAAVAGIVELATTAEAVAGTDTVRAVTPAGLAAGLAGNGGMRYVDTVEFTASGTFTKASYPWLRAVRVRVQAAGGAGGGAVANPVNQHSSGGGGGGGGYAEALVPASSLAASTTVTIGAAGAAANGGGGGNAAASSFGAHAAASGGNGGGLAASSGLMIGALGGLGGSGTAGDLLTTGQSGGMGSGYATLGQGGLGGSSALGGGGRGAYTGAGGGVGNGAPGGDYGGGGGGASSNSGGSTGTGGNGGPGIILIDLYA